MERIKNKEKKREYAKNYYLKNKDHLKEKSKEQWNNRENKKEYNKNYYKKYKDIGYYNKNK